MLRLFATTVIAGAFPELGSFLSRNLFPVAPGNVMGGAVMVWAVYWFIYCRGQPRRRQ
jgi:formate/nitrite transporter FocA (FNT family)